MLGDRRGAGEARLGGGAPIGSMEALRFRTHRDGPGSEDSGVVVEGAVDW